MAKYDLTGSLEREFTFVIEDKEFTLRKPTVREMRVIASKFSGVDKEEDPEKQAKLGEQAMDELYRFISPLNHTSDLKEVLEDQPIQVQQAFNDMIKKELGAAS